MRPRRSTSAANMSYMELDLSDEEPSRAAEAVEKGADTTTRVSPSKKSKPAAGNSKGKGRASKAKKDGDDDSDFAMSENEDTEVDADEDEEMSSVSEHDASESESVANSAANEADEDIDDVLNFDEAPRPKKARKSGGGAARKSMGSNAAVKNLAETLPPISTLPEIFKDLTSKVSDKLKPALRRIDGRTLRVGTMCSGTESPLLALGLISNALKDLTGTELKVEHIFSCEIEPYKQAYIERNFSPPLLFRDVTELGEDQALTAYGGLADVPGDIDLLVAGTSCVDYSPLNRQKKTIDAGGESGRTFFGMLDYVIKHQPSIVVLENVSGAPWDEVVERFAEIGYDAAVMRLDTKHYYIPHTRTRGYLMAVPQKSGVDASDWQEIVQQLRRPASVPLEAFLLPTDDLRIQRAREDLAVEQQTKDGVRRAPTDWIKCESRHHRAREEEMLGNKRPLTAWQDAGGPPTLPDGSWNDWAVAQTERVLDLMDISVLRLAKKGTDVSYKSAVWNLSQNVDRTTGSVLLGICPCLTPNMIPYLASRGGPITGVEALALQGIPIDQLLLTRENQDQLADLAGNAMSSTVVGAAILASLVVAGKTIQRREHLIADAEEAPASATKAETKKASVEGHEQLKALEVSFGHQQGDVHSLLQKGVESARRCICEGRTGTTERQIWTCTSCGHSACTSCKARPDHTYIEDQTARIPAADFERTVKQMLPMRFKLQGFNEETMATARKAAKQHDHLDDKLGSKVLDIVVDAMQGAEFFFRNIYRRSTWLVTFKSDKAKLALELEADKAVWSLYADCPKDLAVNNPVRRFLEEPVARMQVKGAQDLSEGDWQLRLPASTTAMSLKLEHCGQSVPSWRSEMGLTEYANELRSSRIRVSAPEEASSQLDKPIDGLYELQANCGTACKSLYRRIEPAEAERLFFFLDPTRSGDAEEDSFVFAQTCDRVEYGTVRKTIAKTKAGWRPSKHEGEEKASLIVTSIWSDLRGASFADAALADAAGVSEQISLPESALELTATGGSCQSAQVLLSADVQPPEVPIAATWLQNEWFDIDVLHEGPEVFDNLGWVVVRSQTLDAIKQWQPLALEDQAHVCEKCCPPTPAVQWMRKANSKVNSIVAVENGIEAGRFEQALKARPQPLVVQTRLVDDHLGLRIALNVASLAHRALGSLPVPDKSFKVASAAVEWRLRSGEDADLALGRSGLPPVFTLGSNRHDNEAEQPPHFKKVKLRKEQLRSLTWMIRQEAEPRTWVEEEVSEAVLPQLGWHAEARATREVTIRGGILADEVGYGKTAISVGLISAQLDKTPLPEDADRIPVKATLIVVPGHLTSQWPSEIAKFTSGHLEVLTIKDVADLKRRSIKDFMNADIVLVSVTVFRSPLYWASFGDFCASPRGIKMDPNAGRYFRTCVDEAVAALPSQLETLRDAEQGAKAAYKAIDAARKERSKSNQVAEEPPRRLKGRAYAFAQEQAKKMKGKVVEAKPVKAKAEKADAKTEDDPWQLKSSDVKSSWKRMKNPALAMFAFSRLIIDEFTYLDALQLAAVRSLRAPSRWILSGTPPMKDFYQIKTIAALLHVHLGIDDETEGNGREIKARSKEKTSAETFHSFRDVRTAGWHRRRDEIAQRFLDQFARQNWAEIDEIAYEEEIASVELPAAEMAIYRELEHHLLALDANLTKLARVDKKKQGDREVRLLAALGESKTPEEALLKRCSHFSLDMDEETAALESAPHVCDQIVRRRQTQLEQCREDLLQLIVTCAHMHRILVRDGFYNEASGSKKADDRPFQLWLNNAFGPSVGDDEAAEALRDLAKQAGCADAKVGSRPEGAPKPQGLDDFNKARESKVSPEEYRQAKLWILRENCHRLRQLQKELIGRYRSKRYFECVRNVQCGKIENVDNLAILSCCGHQGPIEEVRYAAARQECVVAHCRAAVRSTNVVLASTLGRETDSGHFGVKLETLVDIIDTIPDDDRILVFVQFDDLFDKVKEALEAYDIPSVCLTGTAKNKGATLERFQDPNSKNQRVLILRVTDSSASGANLTVANWAFFVSPLLTDTLQQYKSFETQAIGRIRRYGQMRPVRIVRMMTASTIDVDIFENRTNELVADRLAEQALKWPEHASGYPKKTRQPNRERKAVVGVKEEAKKGKGRAGAASTSKANGKKRKADSEDELSDSWTDSDSDAAPVKKKSSAKAKGKEPATRKSHAKAKTTTASKKASPSRAGPSKEKEVAPSPRRAMVVDDSSDSEEEVAVLLMSSPAASRTASPVKRRRIVESEEDEADEQPASRIEVVVSAARAAGPPRKKVRSGSESTSTGVSAKESSMMDDSEVDTALTTPAVEKESLL